MALPKPFTFVFKTNVTDDGLSVSIPDLTVTCDGKTEMSAVGVQGQTTEVDIKFTKTLTVLLVKSDQAVVLKTNTTDGADVITLAANGVVVFGTDGVNTIGANPIVNADVTKIYIVNAGINNANVEVRAGYDATP